MFLLIFLILSFIVSCQNSHNPARTRFDAYRFLAVSIHYSRHSKPNGTGLLLPDGKTILTCEHVIHNWEATIHVSYLEKDTQPAKVLAKNEDLDLALLQVDIPLTLLPGKIRYKEKVETGEEVFTFGSLYGFSYSFLKGYVSHPSRKDVDLSKIPYIHIMGLAYSGVSGAPVFTIDGYFIGIVRGSFGYGIENGNSMIIPVSVILPFLKQNHIDLN